MRRAHHLPPRAPQRIFFADFDCTLSSEHTYVRCVHALTPTERHLLVILACTCTNRVCVARRSLELGVTGLQRTPIERVWGGGWLLQTQMFHVHF